MSTSKNRAATTCTKVASPLTPRGTLIGSSSTARKTVPRTNGHWRPRRFIRASSASCWFHGRFATSLAAASGSSPPQIPLPRSLSISGSGRQPSSRIMRNLVHYNWHWFWDFGNGDIGNQGVHEMDKARWLIPPASAGHGNERYLPQDRSEPGGPLRLSRPGRDGQYPDLRSWITATPSSSSRSAG